MPHVTHSNKSLNLWLCVAFSFIGFSQTQIVNWGLQFSEDKTTWKPLILPYTWYTEDVFDDQLGYHLSLGYYKKQIFFSSKNTSLEPLFQTTLEGCFAYKVDVPDSNYLVKLFFVEPQIKSSENIYNSSDTKYDETKTQRIFDIYLNDIVIQKQFNLAKAYPEKYGVTLTATLQIRNSQGLSIALKENAVPTVLYHGTKDHLVPFDVAPHHYCAPDKDGYLILHGSNAIARKLEKLDISYYFNSVKEGQHEISAIPFGDLEFIFNFCTHAIDNRKFVQTKIQKRKK